MRVRQLLHAVIRRRMTTSLVLLGLGCALVVQSMGWAQTSYVVFAKALDHGTPSIDRWQWETHDKSYYRGHFYSVKAPGLVFATLPVYALVHAAGGDDLAHTLRLNGDHRDEQPWTYRGLRVFSYGGSPARATATRAEIADDAPVTWLLVLVGVLSPALALCALVGRAAERVAPGTGVASAITLGTGTLLLPFETLYFSHVLSALLGFGAFMVAWGERSGARRRYAALVASGLLAGLAVTTEYPLLVVAAIVGAYAVSRPLDRTRRAIAYVGGAVAGVVPLLAYNVWAFGNPLHMSYADAVAQQGTTGHATLGENGGGLFGITVPRPGDAVSLLVGGRGLLTLAPVLIAALAGVVVIYRRGHRAEATTILAVAVAFLVYDAGYWLPFGGGSPGPRFLIPVIPFLCVGLGPAWRRWPTVTMSLAVAGAAVMTLATITQPLIGNDRPGTWWSDFADKHQLVHTVLDMTGIAHGPWTVAPVVVLIGLALAVGFSSLGARHLARGAGAGLLALGGWFAAAAILPKPLGWAPCTSLVHVCGTTSAASGDGDDLALLLAAAIAALAVLALSFAIARVRPRAWRLAWADGRSLGGPSDRRWRDRRGQRGADAA